MGNILTKLFSKSKKKEKIPATGFKTSLDENVVEKLSKSRTVKGKDIIVKTDVAFHNPATKIIDEIKSKFQKTDFSNLEFEEDIEDFNLKALSPKAKKLIIQIIKEDNKTRELKIQNYKNEVKNKETNS